jgi:uncharacterized Zn-binding protein involved in type VI secretion
MGQKPHAQGKTMETTDSENVSSQDTGAGGEANRPFVVLDDMTTHGGVVITASENTFSNGRRVARLGDLVRCPLPRHGVNPIVSACPLCEIDGRRIARHGDMTACGSMLIASQLDSGSQ